MKIPKELTYNTYLKYKNLMIYHKFKVCGDFVSLPLEIREKMKKKSYVKHQTGYLQYDFFILTYG